MQHVDAVPQPRREHLLELRDCAHRRLLDAGDPCCRAQPDRNGNGLIIVEEERRQRGTSSESVAAADAGRRVHRVPQATQTFDVIADRARGHLQPIGELRA